ncbi:MAG: signal transduction histidine kinase, partial [Cognaticolwellia sp.]
FWAGRRRGGLLGRSLMLVSVGTALNLLPAVFVGLRPLFVPAWAGVGMHALNLLGALGGVLGLLSFALQFPLSLVNPERMYKVMRVGWFAVPFVTAFDLLGLSGLVQIATFPPTFGAAGALIYSAVESKAVVQRMQGGWIGWGLGATVLVALIINIPPILGQPLPAKLYFIGTTLALLPVPVGLGLAALEFRLLLVRSALQWLTAIGGAAILVLMYGAVSGEDSSALLLLIPAVGLLLGMVPRAFGRTQEQARVALERLPYELAGTQDLPQATALFLERVRAIAGSRPAILYLRQGKADLPWEGISELGLMLSDGMSDNPAQVWLAQEQVEVLIPVGTSSGLVGALTLGSGSGSLPPAGDLEALQAAAAAMGATVSHRMAVDTIIAMNRELEVLVERRTEERDEARLKSFRWERVAALSTLSAGIGHELASPLGVALSSMDQVMRALEKERYDRVERFARLSLDGVRRASEIVRNLQVFSQPGIDRLQRFDPSAGIELSVRLLQKRMDRKQVQVEIQGIAPKLRGYPVLVHQVVYNLLHNAVKMSPQGGVVQLNFSQDETTMRLEVVDQGPGVPEELRRTLFDPFETTRDDATASGLGLSLCASFVTLHGGEIYQEDPPEGGARFVIELPLEGPPDGDQAGVLQGL